MNKINKYLWIIAMLLLSGNLHARESETYREFLAKYLHFYYVASPNDISLAYRLDNAMMAQKDTCTDCGDFWTSFNTENAKDLIRALLRAPDEGGDLKLQRFADDILSSPFGDEEELKPIQIWIYDDLKEPLNKNALEVYEPCIDDEGYVWPCAAGLKASDFEDYGGFMHLGTLHLHNLGLERTKNTFLHELAHTLDYVIAQPHASHLYEPTLWLQDEKGRERKYPVIEASSSWPSAYREGLANTFDLLYDLKQAERIFNWYTQDNILLVDALYDKKYTNVPEEEWLYHRICNDIIYKGEKPSTKEYDPMIAEYYREYYIQDLSPEFIIRNEMIMALMFSHYAKYIGIDRFKISLFETYRMSSEEKKDPFKLLLYHLLAGAMPGGHTIFTISESSGEGPKPHLLLMAYVDYFTQYRINSKEEFAKALGLENGEYTGATKNDVLITHINLYWDQAKDDVRGIVTLDDTYFDDLEVIADILEIPIPG